MSLIHVKSHFKEFVYQFLNTPTNEDLESIVLGLLQDVYSNRIDFGKYIKIILIDGANVGILNSSIIKAYHKAIADEEGRGFTVIPIIVSNNIQGGFVHLNRNSVFIGVNDASKTIDDAIIGTILVLLGKNINFFPRLVAVTICSSDFKLINTTDDDRCMSGSYPFREGQGQRSIFGGALCLWADTRSRDLAISFLIPDAHKTRIPKVNYECFDDPERLLNQCMMDIDDQFLIQLNEQRKVDRSIRDLFLGMFVQGRIYQNGLVYENRSAEDARQYATSLTPEYPYLLKLVAMVQP